MSRFFLKQFLFFQIEKNSFLFTNVANVIQLLLRKDRENQAGDPVHDAPPCF